MCYINFSLHTIRILGTAFIKNFQIRGFRQPVEPCVLPAIAVVSVTVYVNEKHWVHLSVKCRILKNQTFLYVLFLCFENKLLTKLLKTLWRFTNLSCEQHLITDCLLIVTIKILVPLFIYQKISKHDEKNPIFSKVCYRPLISFCQHFI